jgi:GNAT superfamily N-acetyltransferase
MLYHDSSHRLDQSRIAEVDGTIASYARVVDRPIRYGHAVLRMAGIGAVATLPEYGGRGLATALLTDAVAYMRAQGYHLSMLFAGIPTFYARMGWVSFPEHTFRCPFTQIRPDPVRSVYTVRPFDPDCDLAAVERIYDEDNEGRTGPCIRYHQHWLDGHSRLLGILPALVARRDDEVVAYASCHERGDSLRLYEAACRAGAQEAFLPLAQTILERAAAFGAGAIEGQLPHGHELLAALRHLAGEPVDLQTSCATMLRPINLQALFQAALLAFADRLRDRPIHGAGYLALGFDVAGERVRLSVDQNRVSLGVEPADRVLDLDAGTFFRLFLGERQPALLADELTVHGVELSDRERALLGTLFPQQNPIYWQADRF